MFRAFFSLFVWNASYIVGFSSSGCNQWNVCVFLRSWNSQIDTDRENRINSILNWDKEFYLICKTYYNLHTKLEFDDDNRQVRAMLQDYIHRPGLRHALSQNRYPIDPLHHRYFRALAVLWCIVYTLVYLNSRNCVCMWERCSYFIVWCCWCVSTCFVCISEEENTSSIRIQLTNLLFKFSAK